MRKQRSGNRRVREQREESSRSNGERRDVDVQRVLRADSADAFIREPDDGPPRVDDDLAETLAEEFIHSATSGEDQTEAALDQMVPEEIGGPFVETTADEEFADDTDESNPPGTEPEPLPRAVNGLAGRPREA
jgi:hypothetical protein